MNFTLSQYVVLGFLAIASIFDLMARKVPNYVVGSGMLLAFIFSASNHVGINVMDCLFGGLLGLIIFYYPYAKGYLGAADTKLTMMVGMFLGPRLSLWAFIFSCLSGGFIAMLAAISQCRLKKSFTNIYQYSEVEMNFPYAIAIFTGTSMAIFNCQRVLL